MRINGRYVGLSLSLPRGPPAFRSASAGVPLGCGDVARHRGSILGLPAPPLRYPHEGLPRAKALAQLVRPHLGRRRNGVRHLKPRAQLVGSGASAWSVRCSARSALCPVCSARCSTSQRERPPPRSGRGTARSARFVRPYFGGESSGDRARGSIVVSFGTKGYAMSRSSRATVRAAVDCGMFAAGGGKPFVAGDSGEKPKRKEAIIHSQAALLNTSLAGYTTWVEKSIFGARFRAAHEFCTRAACIKGLQMLNRCSFVIAALCAILPLAPAEAQVAVSGKSLPLALAEKAANTAIAACEHNGYAVTAVVVDTSGLIKLQAKGDHSTVHTPTSAFRKAFTVVTMGPIFHLDTSSAFAAAVAKNPSGAALSSLPDIAPLPGGVAVKLGNEIIAALGIAGSPGGDKDEACAQVGVGSIQNDLAGLTASKH